MEEILNQLKPMMLRFGLAAVAVGVLLILFRLGREWRYRRQVGGSQRPAGEISSDDAEEREGTIPLANPRSLVRKWKVSGVEKAGGNDATWFIEAESRANAKVKAELKGMIVTAVERAAKEG